VHEQIDGMLNEKQRDLLNAIDERAKHLLSLANHILDLSKIEGGQLSIQYDTHDIDLLCRSSLLFIRRFAWNKGVEIVYSNPASKLSMYTDGSRLKQILVILLHNAVKFTPTGGCITLLVKPRESKQEIEFVVQDTGIGIDEHHMSGVFNPLIPSETRLPQNHEGTGGVGLALVAALTDILGGNVAVESARHAGSKFTVTLPLGSAPTDQSHHHASVSDKLPLQD
jgi:signal transduction histidine kinase